MEAQAKQAMGKIESLARKQYLQDLREQSNGESEPKRPTSTREAAEERADLEIKKAAEKAYRESASGGASGEVNDWLFDPQSGYYVSKTLSCYYDGHSGMYFYGDKWRKDPPKRADPAEYERFYSKTAVGDDVAEGASGPRTLDNARKVSTATPGPSAGAGTEGSVPARDHHAATRGKIVVKPIKKITKRSNQSIGGYQMPIEGRFGGAKDIGRAAVTKPIPVACGGAGARKTKSGKQKDLAEERALKAREAAKKRVEQRTMANFGLK